MKGEPTFHVFYRFFVLKYNVLHKVTRVEFIVQNDLVIYSEINHKSQNLSLQMSELEWRQFGLRTEISYETRLCEDKIRCVRKRHANAFSYVAYDTRGCGTGLTNENNCLMTNTR